MSDGAAGVGAMIRQGFYVGMAVLITAFAVADFWPTYWLT